MVLFETMELPMSLAGVVSMSPAKRSPPAVSVIRSAAILEQASKSVSFAHIQYKPKAIHALLLLRIRRLNRAEY